MLVIIYIVHFCLADTFMDASKVAMIQKHAILQSKVDPPFQRYSFCYFFNSNFWVGKKLEEEETNWEWKAKLVISLLYSLPYCDFSWRSSINTADTLNDYFLLSLYSSCKENNSLQGFIVIGQSRFISSRSSSNFWRGDGNQLLADFSHKMSRLSSRLFRQ